MALVEKRERQSATNFAPRNATLRLEARIKGSENKISVQLLKSMLYVLLILILLKI